MFTQKKTLSGINSKFEALAGEYVALETQAKTELEVIAEKEAELSRQRDFQQSELEGASLVKENLSKFLTQRL